MLEGARFSGVVGLPVPSSASANARITTGLDATSSRDVAALAEQNSVLTQIARPYAAALFDLSQSEGSVDTVESGLVELQKLAGESEDFRRFLRSPVISADEKSGAVDAILGQAKLNPTVSNFVKVVARNGRLFALPAIIKAFQTLSAQQRGEVSAEVTSAAPLSKTQLSALADTLKSKIGKTVTLTEHVDPSLIGGLVVKVGSQMIDSSLKTKLAAMKIAMKEVG
jgi:F-type H+-transporting ATPase subunit delta